MRSSLAYRKIVLEFSAWRDVTLTNLERAIHLGGAIHIQAMEMNRRALVAKLIINIDNDCVSSSGI